MAHTDWKLTAEEKERCIAEGMNLDAAQDAKKKAYVLAGGVILNPDALGDLYEALKGLKTKFKFALELAGREQDMSNLIERELTATNEALSKAEDK